MPSFQQLLTDYFRAHDEAFDRVASFRTNGTSIECWVVTNGAGGQQQVLTAEMTDVLGWMWGQFQESQQSSKL